MLRLNSHRLLVVLVIVFIGGGQADARPPWVGQKSGDLDSGPNSVAQQQPVMTAVTSFVIGGVTLQEDVKNPPVPSGMQRFEITLNQPVVTVYPEGGFNINRDFRSHPIDLVMSIYLAPDLAASADLRTLTGTVNLSEGATYQVLFGEAEYVPISEQQQYFFGTVELPDATVSGTVVLPEGFRPYNDEGGTALIDSEAYSNFLSMIGDEGFNDIDLLFRSIVRIASFNEQMEFELQHVPDGTYALIAGQEAVDAISRIDLFHDGGLNLITGDVDSTALIRVVDGKSVTGLQVMLQDQEGINQKVTAITEARVLRVEPEHDNFWVEYNDVEVRVRVRETVTLDVTNAKDVFALFFSGDVTTVEDFLVILLSADEDALAEHIFSITDLMPGDTVSMLGVPYEEATMEALLVLRHAQTSTVLRGDLDSDGDVDFSDFLLFVAAFNSSVGDSNYQPLADIDGNGVIDFSDFLSFVNLFGAS